MKSVVLLHLLVLGITCGTAWAETPAKRWSNRAEVSFIRTGGNTDVTTLSLKNLFSYAITDPLSISAKLEALSSKEGGSQTAERYLAELRGDYLFTQRMYGIASTTWLRDTFAGIATHYDGNLGGGYKFVDGPRHTLLGEAGATYTYEEYTNGSTDNYPGARLFGKYRFAFAEKNAFTQSVEYLQSLDQASRQVITSETAVIAALNSIFSLKTSYTLRFHSKPVPADLKKTDTILEMALVASF